MLTSDLIKRNCSLQIRKQVNSLQLQVRVADQCIVSVLYTHPHAAVQEECGPPQVQFIVPLFQFAEEAAASCFSGPPRPVERPRGIPTVTLFLWPFTWQEETGHQCFCVFVKITESPPLLSPEVSGMTCVFIVKLSALMMLNNILDYFKWGHVRV